MVGVSFFLSFFVLTTSSLLLLPATTLCALHYASCAMSTATINASRARGPSPPPPPRTLPRRDLALFTATANASIVSLNLSLMLNKVGFYQVAKLLIIPFVCAVERVWLGRRFPPAVAAAVGVVVAGVAVVTVTDVTSVGGASAAGAAVAAVSVVTSGMQQILCRSMQQAHGLTAHELLSNTAPAQVGGVEGGGWGGRGGRGAAPNTPHPPSPLSGRHPARGRPFSGPLRLVRLGL